MLIGLDMGYNFVKATNGQRDTFFPSVVGTYQEGTYSLANSYKPLVCGNQAWNVGDEALGQSAYTASLRDPEWYTTNIYGVLLCETFSRLAKANARAKIVTGLPLQHYNAHAQRLQEVLCGPWGFTKEQRQVMTVDHTLVITQSYGALLNYAMDNTGKLLDNEWTRYVGIADIGGNTMNVLTTDSLKEIARHTEGDGFGLLDALDQVRDAIKADFRLDAKTHEVSQWVAQGCFEAKGKTHDIAPYTAALDPLVDLLLARFSEVWTEPDRMGAVLLTGGGAMLLGERLKERMEQYPPVIIGDQWDNARGYYKLARRLEREGEW